MEISVVVPTLNARDELAACLDALAEYAPDQEVIVVNGPSADGTTGMVQDRDIVDVLIELADRQVTAARNAGIDRATGEAIAFVDHRLSITATWLDGLVESLATADVVTGPTHRRVDGQTTRTNSETSTIADRTVTYFNSGNVAFRREVLEELDGFDEYLEIGGSRDLAHRIGAVDFDITWSDWMRVDDELGTDGGETQRDWGWKYRSLAYRLVKNYNLRPAVIARLLAHGGSDAVGELRQVLSGNERPSAWLGTGKTILLNIVLGIKDGLDALRRDRTSRRNPYGRSSRGDRAVSVYDWR